LQETGLEEKKPKSLSEQIQFEVDEFGELVGPVAVDRATVDMSNLLPPVGYNPAPGYNGPVPAVRPVETLPPYQSSGRSTPIPATPTKPKRVKKRPEYRRLSAPREQVILWWGGVLFGLILLGLGAFLWVYGTYKEAQQVPLPAVDVKNLTIREPLLPPNQQISFEAKYAEAQAAFDSGKPEDAVNALKPVVEVAPNFKKDAVAFLLVAERAAGLDKMGDSKDEQAVIAYFDEALNLKDNYPDELLVQFKLKPGLLPAGITDLNGLVSDINRQKQWFELYRQGESFQANRQINWFDNSITPWRTLYDQNRTFLKDKGDRWVALRLLEAYQAQSTYNCKTNKDYNKARRSLIDARGITIDNGMTNQRTTIDKKLTDIAAQGCN
jgi:tetratricopeptide (TPR) repeat protein